jgi:nucleotide-binding universal stress UspA family protein
VKFDKIEIQSAQEDFRSARQRAALQELIGRLTGRSTRLLSYEEVAQKLKLAERSERGIRQIPVRAIVGSVGRYNDFTRTFLPRQQKDQARWVGVKASMSKLDLLPIEVYQVGEVYFVLDGNHRVSIAQQQGIEYLDAYVTEMHTPIPLTPDVQPDDLIVKAEYADFLASSRLGESRPGIVISFTMPGQYKKLMERIAAEAICGEEKPNKPINIEQAAQCWVDEVYLPMAETVREQGLLRWFPDRTEADLILWVLEHRDELQGELSWDVSAKTAGTHLAVKKHRGAKNLEKKVGSWRQARMVDRYIDHLFKDILVPLNGQEDSWGALQQALAVAAREDAIIHGLHIVAEESGITSPEVSTIRLRFEQLCTQAAVNWDFHVETGEIASRICDRARLADLVVLNTTYPPQAGLAGLSSGLRSIILNCTRPILATCGKISTFDRALLAFNGSPKAREALFVAAYLAEQWMTSLTVVIIMEEKDSTQGMLNLAREYLELHEVEATYLAKSGPLSSLPEVMDELNINLLLMGGYSGSALEEVVASSMVDLMLRANRCPIFICR